MFAVDTVHLRYVLNRQRCRLHLHLKICSYARAGKRVGHALDSPE